MIFIISLFSFKLHKYVFKEHNVCTSVWSLIVLYYVCIKNLCVSNPQGVRRAFGVLWTRLFKIYSQKSTWNAYNSASSRHNHRVELLLHMLKQPIEQKGALMSTMQRNLMVLLWLSARRICWICDGTYEIFKENP